MLLNALWKANGRHQGMELPMLSHDNRARAKPYLALLNHLSIFLPPEGLIPD
jgi:hypothetical protein